MVQNLLPSFPPRPPIARGGFLVVPELALVAAIILLDCRPHRTHPSAQLHLYGDINPNVSHPLPSHSFGVPLHKVCKSHPQVPCPCQLHPLCLPLRLLHKIVLGRVVLPQKIRLVMHLLLQVHTRNPPCSVWGCHHSSSPALEGVYMVKRATLGRARRLEMAYVRGTRRRRRANKI